MFSLRPRTDIDIGSDINHRRAAAQGFEVFRNGDDSRIVLVDALDLNTHLLCAPGIDRRQDYAISLPLLVETRYRPRRLEEPGLHRRAIQGVGEAGGQPLIVL